MSRFSFRQNTGTTVFLLVTILLVGSALRFYDLAKNPPGFFCDEADIGRQSHHLLHTGRDTYGVLFPVFFQGLGDYKNPVAIYSSLPPIALFGLSEWSVRFQAVLYGCLCLIFIFLLLQTAFDDTEIGIWGAFFLAISPWHIHLSRIGMEFSPSFYWFCFGVYGLFRSHRTGGAPWLAQLGFGFALLSYYTYWFYLPLTLLAYAAAYPAQVKCWMRSRRFWILTAVIAVVFGSLVLPSMLSGNFLTRWQSVKSNLTWQQKLLAYANHFTPSFLFVDGDSDFQGQSISRHSVVGMGVVHLLQFPFLVLAFIAWRKIRSWRPPLTFFFLLTLAYPLGSCLVTETPYATRSNMGILPFTALTAVGIRFLILNLSQPVAPFLFLWRSGLVLAQVPFVAAFLYLQHFIYPLRAADFYGWQSGIREVWEFFSNSPSDYDDHLITHSFNGPQALVDFYNLVVPCKHCGIFPNPPRLDRKKQQLLALRLDEIREVKRLYPTMEIQVRKSVFLPNGTPQLLIVEFRAIDSVRKHSQ